MNLSNGYYMPLVAYPQPHKLKSYHLCTAFAKGAGGIVAAISRYNEGQGCAAFYGVVGIESIFYDARASGCNWFYMDNAYFDSLREQYFRVGKNALQTYREMPDHARMKAMGVVIEPWRMRRGRDVLVVEQSDYFMDKVARWYGGMPAWRAYVLDRITGLTGRVIVIRNWGRNKASQSAEFAQELEKAWIVVTHSSAAACEAIRRGVPAIVTDENCAAYPVAGNFASSENAIEKPYMPDCRDTWAASLCALQWTQEEFEKGVAWRTLRKC